MKDMNSSYIEQLSPDICVTRFVTMMMSAYSAAAPAPSSSPVCMSEPCVTFPDMHSMPAATATTATILFVVSFSLKIIGLRMSAIIGPQ